MSDQYLGEIRNFAFNFAPTGWFQCQGQLLPVAQYSALFALLGVTYGGNGSTTFGLPDLRGRAPIGLGTGAGLPPVTQGQMGGQSSVTINSMQLPMHNHSVTFAAGAPAVAVSVQGSSAVGDTSTAAGNYLAGSIAGVSGRGAGLLYTDTPGVLAPIGGASASLSGTVPTTVTGGNLPIQTESPFLGSNWCIAWEGLFPSRP